MTEANMARLARSAVVSLLENLEGRARLLRADPAGAHGGRLQPPLCGERQHGAADAARLDPARRPARPSIGPSPSPFSPKPWRAVAEQHVVVPGPKRLRSAARTCDADTPRSGPDQGSGSSPGLGGTACCRASVDPSRSDGRAAAALPAQAKGRLVWRAWLAAAVLLAGIAAILLSRDVMRDWDRLRDRGRTRAPAGLFSERRAAAGDARSRRLRGRLAAHGVSLGAPVFIRIFKREFELELWLKRDDRFQRFAVYPICRWSGELGPKIAQGDRRRPRASIRSIRKRSIPTAAGTARSTWAFPTP